MSGWIWVLVGYLAGSFPTGYVIVKLLRNEDIRNFGSGNIGATNVGRRMGKKWAVAVTLIDMIKGGVVLILARVMNVESPPLLQQLPSPAFVVTISPYGSVLRGEKEWQQLLELSFL